MIDIDKIIVNRIGNDAQSYMITDAVIGYVMPGNSYQVTHEGLIQTENIAAQKIRREVGGPAPLHVRFTGSWITSDETTPTDANIFGGLGTLAIGQSDLEIPEAPATAAALAYYDAHLVEIDDVIEFESDAVLPVTLMSIGSTYVDQYLKVEEKGGGAYLEYHDMPHFHMPIDASASGHLILGRAEDNEYILSAFKIPFGFGIYTPPNVLHADAYLVGKYLVVYAETDHFSTVIFRSPNQGLVDVRIAAL